MILTSIMNNTEAITALNLIKRAVKSNMNIVKDANIPLCGGSSEAFKEAPTVIFLEKASKRGISKEQAMEYLEISEKDIDFYISIYENQSFNKKYQIKSELVDNYLKYHG